MAIYQFLVAVRTAGAGGGASTQLMNEAGEVTSHLQGLWYRTLKFVESGIKPVYVFDGKPPALKGGELAKRKDAKVRARAGRRRRALSRRRPASEAPFARARPPPGAPAHRRPFLFRRKKPRRSWPPPRRRATPTRLTALRGAPSRWRSSTLRSARCC
jgi:hypothetical protein